MSRDDLLLSNAKIMKSVAQGLKPHCRDAVFIIVSNPLDAMALVAKEILDIPRERILGMAGVLDTARFKGFVAEAAEVSVKDVHAFVLGGHGDTMVPVTRYCSVSGVPLSAFLSEEKIEEIVERTRKGGAEIVKHLKTGSAYYAPSASVVQMAESILKDQNRVLPCAAFLQGEYGAEGLFMGVMCQLNHQGLKKIIPLELNEKENKEMQKSIEAVKGLIADLRKMDY